VAMLPKPLSECNALAITTGSYINANGAASMSIPCYALCDESAISVIDGHVEVLSEGEWRYFPRPESEPSQKASV